MKKSAIETLTESIPYKEFYFNFLFKNVPCIIDSWVVKNWFAFEEWCTPMGEINILRLFEGINDHPVCVADCGRLEFGSHTVQSMDAKDFISYWLDSSDVRLLYLKDWHYFKDNERGHLYYNTPMYFSSDWMNEFWSFRRDVDDDFRFVYVGKKGTWTPLHADVYRSYSWSANISGVKRWWFFAPGEEKKLSRELGSMPVDVRECSPDALDRVAHFVFDQRPGQIVFVPSGWFHQVVNLVLILRVPAPSSLFCHVTLSGDGETPVIKRDSIALTVSLLQGDKVCLRALAGINFSELFTLLKYILVTRWAGARNQLLTRAEEGASREISSEATGATGSGDPVSLQSSEIDKHLLNLVEQDPSVMKRFLDEGDCRWRSCLLGDTSKTSLDEQDVSSLKWLTCHEFVSALKLVKDFVNNPTVKLLGLNHGPLQHYFDQL